MRALRTPDDRFVGLPDWPFEPRYAEIPDGEGQVITGAFRHQAEGGVELTIEGEPEPIRCTGNHPTWSEDRQEFVRADHLQLEEQLRTTTGLTKLSSSMPLVGQAYVYNIEVQIRTFSRK